LFFLVNLRYINNSKTPEGLMKHFLGAMMLISCTMHLLVASDWPQFQRDPQHTGRTPDSVPFGSGDTGYRLRWMWQGAAGTIRNKLANPLWDGPTVYPKTPIYDPTRNNIWDQRIPQSVPFTLAGLAQPVVVGERVYIGDQDGKVYCINTDDGSTIWTADNPGGTCGAAAVGNNVAVFTSMTGYVRGYHADNGTLLWTFKTRGPVTAAPVMEGTDIYVACHGRRAYRINMLTGAVVWTSPDLGAQVVQPVALDARSVYTAAENMRAFALNKDDGSIRAQRTVGGQSFYGQWPVVWGGFVFFVAAPIPAIGSEQTDEIIRNSTTLSQEYADIRAYIQGQDPGNRWRWESANWKYFTALSTDAFTEPFLVPAGPAEGCGTPPIPPSVDNQGNLLLYMKTRFPSFIKKNGELFGTEYSVDIRRLNLSNGDGIPINNSQFASDTQWFTWETDNLYAMSIASSTLWLHQDYRGSVNVSLTTSQAYRPFSQSNPPGWTNIQVLYTIGWDDMPGYEPPRYPATTMNSLQGRSAPVVSGTRFYERTPWALFCGERNP
jgi:hypothetical protein